MLVFVKQKSKTKHNGGDNDKNMERWAVWMEFKMYQNLSVAYPEDQ